MFYKLIVITLIIKSLSSIPPSRLPQSRNVAIEFRQMINNITGRSAFDYLGYGCHCGLGGKGKVVDAIDKCCQIHDHCYDITQKISPFSDLCVPHVVTYSWYVDNRAVRCISNNDVCGYRTCWCDKAAVECFSRNIYNEQYKDYNQSLCL